MKTIYKSLLLAAAPIAIAGTVLPTVASAQVTGSIAVASLDEAVQKSNAFVLAVNQIKITYKPQLDAFDARSKVLNAELQPLVAAFQTAQKAPNPNQAALQTQFTALQTKQQNAQKELQGLYAPIGRAQAYAEEQIVAKLDGVLKTTMTAKKVALVLQPQATISYQPTVDITSDIITGLNGVVATVSVTPPAGWQPGGQGQAGAPAAAAATPAKPAPTGR
ncbi:MAG: OmpH family outer membrane protein [Sphingomonadaceae bacterium]